MIIYYERYVVIQPGECGENEEGEPSSIKWIFLTEEEYLSIILESLPARKSIFRRY